jgi:hypothetical protein
MITVPHLQKDRAPVWRRAGRLAASRAGAVARTGEAVV